MVKKLTEDDWYELRDIAQRAFEDDEDHYDIYENVENHNLRSLNKDQIELLLDVISEQTNDYINDDLDEDNDLYEDDEDYEEKHDKLVEEREALADELINKIKEEYKSDDKLNEESNNKCPSGQEYVPAYKKKDGTYVKGFCRKVKKK